MLEKMESSTAKFCAFARAYHSKQVKNKIFDDYLAYDLIGQEEYEKIYQFIIQYLIEEKLEIGEVRTEEIIGDLIGRNIAPIPLSRIRFAEEKLKDFVEKNGECQYVICGAGFDTFAFRNQNPKIQIYELDHPNTQEYKLNRLKELNWEVPSNVHFAPINFEKESIEEVLNNHGFNENKKTFFSILGVTYYLSLPVFSNSISHISSLCSEGSMVVFDYPDQTMLDMNSPKRIRELSEFTKSLGEEMKGGFSFDEIKDVLHKDNFIIDTYMSPQQIQETFFEKRKDKYKAFENVHFILANYKQEEIN